MVTFGGCLDPPAAYLLWRGLQTFELRLARQTGTAAALADGLADRPDVGGWCTRAGRTTRSTSWPPR